MIQKICRLVCCLLLLDISLVSAQTKSTEIQTINSQKYYIHTIQPKETFYGLSKLYDVSIDEIQMNNNNIKLLNVGDTLRIPYHDERQTQQAVNEINKRNELLYYHHIVMQGETVYSIARSQGISVADLISINPTIQDGVLSIGQILYVPKNTNQSTTSSDTIEKPRLWWHLGSEEAQTSDSSIVQPTKPIHISLLLPFFLNKNTNATGEITTNIYEYTYQFLDYYEGMLLALDSLHTLGYTITLDVIESNNDSASANIQKLNTHTHLIIGPVFPKTFPAAAAFAKRHEIPIISPLSAEETNALNPFVVQMNTPQKYRYKAMVDDILMNHQNCNVCLVYNSEQDKKNLNHCKAAFAERKTELSAKHISIEEISYTTVGASGLETAIKKKEEAVVIVLSKQQAFANNIVTKLYQTSKSHKVELWGLAQWETYENLELDFLYDLNLKLVTSGEVNYADTTTKHFIETYRNKYNTEPSKFSFQGYDQMMFIAKQYVENEDFITSLSSMEPYFGLHDKYKFHKGDGSTVNTSSFIVTYDKQDSFKRKWKFFIPNN